MGIRLPIRGFYVTTLWGKCHLRTSCHYLWNAKQGLVDVRDVGAEVHYLVIVREGVEYLAPLVHDEAPIRQLVGAAGIGVAGLDGPDILRSDHGGPCATVYEELYLLPFFHLLLNPVEGVHFDFYQ